VTAHRWALNLSPFAGVGADSARCETCGLYVVAVVAALGDRAVAPVLMVAGRYINGGLHMATRVVFDAEYHQCRTTPTVAAPPARCGTCGNVPGEGSPWCAPCRGG
jgi:hypothetical protein